MVRPAGTDPAAQPGQRTDLTSVIETVPVADFIGGGGQRQGPTTQGPHFGNLRLHGVGQSLELFLHRLQHSAEEG
jgi:hypothetical protein